MPPDDPVQNSPAADTDTLRLLRDEALTAMTIHRGQLPPLSAKLAALPPTAGAILALFFAARPAASQVVFSWLYALGVLPFLLIVFMCLHGSDELAAPTVHSRIASEVEIFAELQPTDRLPVNEWLTQSIIVWRAASATGLRYLSGFLIYIRRIRIVFGIFVFYLSIITAAALIMNP